MSVIVRRLGNTKFELYAKGSPEMITSLSVPESVPSDMQEVLMSYTQKGFRVIALAYRQLRLNYVKIQRVQREQVECQLTFLGLVILENQLKPQSAPVIQRLKDAKIRTIMVTGDNMLTALSVARDCHMIGRDDQVIVVTASRPNPSDTALSQSEHSVEPLSNQSEKPEIQYTYAADVRAAEEFDLQTPPTSSVRDVTLTLDSKSTTHFGIMGKSWAAIRKYHPEVIPKLVVRGTVFARFSPDEKQQLVESLQELGYYVGMCGDGANDCGALKTAHTGISLSEAEASVASPFTCKQANISCVLNVIREGRAALVTSFGIFKYMAGYSLTQFMSVCLLYWVRANLTDAMFLYIDLVLQTSLSITFCYTHAYGDIVPKKPKVSLISVTPILSLISQLLINICFQLIAWVSTTRQPWFEPYKLPPEHIRDFTSHEVTAVFSVAAFQYITMAITFSKGTPYRKPMTTNYLFLLNIAVGVALTAYLVVYPFDWLCVQMQIKVSPVVLFRLLLCGLALANFFISLLVETFFIDVLVDEKCKATIKRHSKKSLTKHRVIENELAASIDWPPATGGLTLTEIMKMESGAGHHDETLDETRGGASESDEDESQSDADCDRRGDLGASPRKRRVSRRDSHRVTHRGASVDEDSEYLIT